MNYERLKECDLMLNKEFYTVRGYQLLEQNKKHLTSAMEDYLEMVYRSSVEHGFTRIGTLANLLNVRAPSASKMVQRLSELGLVKFQKYGVIMLSDNGKEIGKYLMKRHSLLESFLCLLGCKHETLQLIELMEHTINGEFLENIQILTEFFIKYPEIKEKYEEYKVSQRNLEDGKE